MDSRRNRPAAYDDHLIEASGMNRRGALPVIHHPVEPLRPPVQLENKLASQAAEIEQLAEDNRRLAASHLALRQELVTAKAETEKVREHMRSIQTEGDIQIRILLDKIAKREADIRAAENIRREHQEAHIEARSLVANRLDLSIKVQQVTEELGQLRANIEKLPEVRAELDSVRQEYQKLRKTFEYEKGLNVEKVEQMKSLEKDLIDVAEQVERLRAQVLDAENRASAPIPYGGPYMNPDNSYPPPFHGNGGYADNFGTPHPHTIHGAMAPYASGGFVVGHQVINGPVGSTGGGAAAAAWGVAYDTSNTHM